MQLKSSFALQELRQQVKQLRKQRTVSGIRLADVVAQLLQVLEDLDAEILECTRTCSRYQDAVSKLADTVRVLDDQVMWQVNLRAGDA